MKIKKYENFLLLENVDEYVSCIMLDIDDNYFESFNKMKNIEDFKETVVEYKKDFLNYIYYNFLHELDARVNQIYEGYLYSNLKTLDEMLEQFKKDKLYNILIYLENFNHEILINKYDSDVLLNLTNQFNILYDINIIKKEDFNKYYKCWEVVFKNNSIKYIKLSEDAIKQAFKKQKRYIEKKSYSYDDTILNEKIYYNCDEEILKLVKQFKKIF